MIWNERLTLLTAQTGILALTLIATGNAPSHHTESSFATNLPSPISSLPQVSCENQPVTRSLSVEEFTTNTSRCDSPAELVRPHSPKHAPGTLEIPARW